MLAKYLQLAFLALLLCSPASAATGCGDTGVWLQVLGSGGPELDDDRASSGYLIWDNGKARLLIDMGNGSLFRFEQSGAALNDLDAILLSHMHVDHSSDLPALIKANYFTNRARDLHVYGPTGNELMPAVTNFVQDLFGPEGAFQYLGAYLEDGASYRVLPTDIDATTKAEQLVLANARYRLTAAAVHHGPIPALAWRVDIADKRIVFSGDMNNDNGTLASLAEEADVLVAHHAIPEGARGAARNLHMPPSVIGEIAAQARVKKLVLSHRMKRTLGQEQGSTAAIREHFDGLMQYADDLQCFRL